MKVLKLLLNLGIMSITPLSIISTVSCSNSKTSDKNNELLPGATEDNVISTETNEIYNKIFGDIIEERIGVKYFENKVQTSITNAKPVESKTREEVLEIAQQKIANMTNTELKSFILISTLKGSEKCKIFRAELESEQINVKKQDIKNVVFDKNKNEISFDYTFYYCGSGFLSNELISVEEGLLSYSIKNLKIKADVLEGNGNLFPIISFEIEQPNAKIILNESKYTYNITDNFLIYRWEKDTEIQNKYTTTEEWIKDYRFRADQAKQAYSSLKSNLGDKCGVVNNVFSFDILYNDIYKSGLFNANIGWEWENETNDQIDAVTTTVTMYSPIFFSSLNKKDGSVNWEVYYLKQ